MTTAAQAERNTSRFRLTPLEIAGGGPLGMHPDEPGLPDVHGAPDPLGAFEAPIRSALERPPCVVTFSGGRDSSAVLAVAAGLARREGLPQPVPVTLRFREAPGTTELEWQERVVSHLGLDDWTRIGVGEEIDFVGPVARPLLLRHGPVHPAATPLFWLALEHARGGSFLTGFGGDAVSGGWLPQHSAEALAGRVRPGLGDLPALAYTAVPLAVRRRVMRTRLTRQVWLRPRAASEFLRRRAAEFGSRPARWDRFLNWEVRLRRSCAAEWTFATLAADVDAVAVHPFHDRQFMAEVARLGGSRGLGDRTSVMRAVFSEQLPDAVLARPDKANFALAYFRGHTRAFAQRWDGGGFDPELVDADALRKVWLSRIVDSRSALALQAAWLDSADRGLEHSLPDLA